MENKIKIDSVEQIGDIEFDFRTLIDNRNGERTKNSDEQIILLAEKINYILWYLKQREKNK